jgi:hypothetical protein
MQLFRASYHFIPLGPNIFFHPRPKRPQTSLNVKDKVSHPYESNGKVAVLYIFIYLFLRQTIQKWILSKALPESKLLFI